MSCWWPAPACRTPTSRSNSVAEHYPHGTTLVGDAATVQATLAAFDGAALAHVAAHGMFRADNPLFSSLRLADGPLTVYDLEGIGHAPRTVVLAACDTARHTARPGRRPARARRRVPVPRHAHPGRAAGEPARRRVGGPDGRSARPAARGRAPGAALAGTQRAAVAGGRAGGFRGRGRFRLLRSRVNRRGNAASSFVHLRFVWSPHERRLHSEPCP